MPANTMETLIPVLLPILAFTLSFLAMYLNANVILTLYGGNSSNGQKALFAFITGPLLSVLPIYILYFLGALDFSNSATPLLYLLFRNTNPLFALLYGFIGIKIMRLSIIRSLRLISISCLFMTVIRSFNLLIGAAFFEQTFYNYDVRKDFIQQLIVLVTAVAAYFIASRLVKRFNAIKIADNPFVRPKHEIVLFLARSSFVYFFSVVLPLCIPNQAFAYSLVILISTLITIVCLQGDFRRADKIELENKTLHINALSESMENFRIVKHDFYNILQTYGGYLEIGDLEALRKYHTQFVGMTTAAGNALDISKRVEENPSLFSLLISKSDYAEKLKVHLIFTLPRRIPDFHIEMIDLCRALGCLLDNAIEAAKESATREVQFTLTAKALSSVLIIISNKTNGAVDTSEILKSGVSGKEGHTGIGLVTVRKTLGRYTNCGFQIHSYNNEFNAYIELKPASN